MLIAFHWLTVCCWKKIVSKETVTNIDGIKNYKAIHSQLLQFLLINVQFDFFFVLKKIYAKN